MNPFETQNETDLNLDLTNDAMDEYGGIVPVGEHEAIITKSEMKSSKTGGKYINVAFKTAHGLVWDMFNVVNQNAKAVEIARQKLKKLLIINQKEPKLGSPAELIGLKCIVAVEHATDSYGTKAKIKFVKESEQIPF